MKKNNISKKESELAIKYIELQKEVELLKLKLEDKKIKLIQLRKDYFLFKENKEQTRLS